MANADDFKDLSDQFAIQAELLELSIKAGRRMMHDFKHLLNEVHGSNTVKAEFETRAKIWEGIFYPDNGVKNYRSELHITISLLQIQLSIAQELLKKHNIDPEPNLPF